jgi:hypothetical protein
VRSGRYLVVAVIGAVAVTAALGCGRAKTEQARTPENPLPVPTGKAIRVVETDPTSSKPLPLASDKN